MSASSADPAPTVDAPSKPFGAGTIVGIAAGLLLLAVCAAYLIVGQGGRIDGAAELESAFGVRSLPLGLEVVRATRSLRGDRMIVLERKDAPPEAPMDQRVGKEHEVADWSKVPIGPEGAPPRQATFLLTDAASAARVLEDLVRNVKSRDLQDLGSGGGVVVVKRDHFDFRGWDAEWVQLRSFEPGGTFRDAMRVSLSTPEKPCVLTVTWPRGMAASKAVLDQLIAPLARR